MTRTVWMLLGLLALELSVGGYFAARRLNQPAPPLPDLSAVDPVLADEIRGSVSRCNSAEQWAELGAVYLATGFFPEAEACLRQAFALDPSRAHLVFKHGFALERLGRLEEANARYEAAVGLHHPRKADCGYYIGKNHLRMEHEETARAAFEQARDLPAARYELALLDARAGRVHEAGASASRLAEEFPAAYPPASLRYRLAVAAGDRRAADGLADLFARKPRPLPGPFDEEVDWVLEKANGVGASRLFRDAGREMQAGRANRAETLLPRALAASWSPEVADKYADVLFALGRQREAADVLSEIVSRDRPSFPALWRLGQARDALGDPAEALTLWERAGRVATGPGAKELWEDLAELSGRLGDRQKEKTYEARASLAAGMQALDAGRLDEATRLLQRATEADTRRAVMWFYLGEAHRLADRPAEARAAYARCLVADPDHGRASRALNLLDSRLPANGIGLSQEHIIKP